MNKIIVLDCKLKEIKNPFPTPNNNELKTVTSAARTAFNGFALCMETVLSHVYEIDDKVFNKWIKECVHFTSEGKLIDKPFSQFLESQIKTDTEEKKPLTLKEILALPIDERRKILKEQANNPAIIEYYQKLDEQAAKDLKMME